MYITFLVTILSMFIICIRFLYLKDLFTKKQISTIYFIQRYLYVQEEKILVGKNGRIIAYVLVDPNALCTARQCILYK